MAEPRLNKFGVWKLQIKFNGRRRQIDLGKIDEAEAKYAAAMINLLVQQLSYTNVLRPELQAWVDNLPCKLAVSLANAGLIEQKNVKYSIGELIDLFLIAYEKSDWASSTKRRMRCSLRRFPDFIREKPVDFYLDRESSKTRIMTINKALLDAGHAKATVSKTNGDLSQVGNWAVGMGFIEFNPFSALPTPKAVNKDRNVDVPAETIIECIKVCGDPDLRIILALARFAGLRIPSELSQLNWTHYDVSENTLSALNNNKQGEDHRKTIPVWPILEKYLQEHWEETAEKSESIVTQETLRVTAAAIRGRAERVIKKAGFQLWPRLFQNLRSSFENDLKRSGIPLADVAEMLGHSEKVQAESYLKLSKKDIDQALKRNPFA